MKKSVLIAAVMAMAIDDSRVSFADMRRERNDCRDCGKDEKRDDSEVIAAAQAKRDRKNAKRRAS